MERAFKSTRRCAARPCCLPPTPRSILLPLAPHHPPAYSILHSPLPSHGRAFAHTWHLHFLHAIHVLARRQTGPPWRCVCVCVSSFLLRLCDFTRVRLPVYVLDLIFALYLLRVASRVRTLPDVKRVQGNPSSQRRLTLLLLSLSLLHGTAHRKRSPAQCP